MAKTTFEALEIGERFHYNVDADGHEPYLYKVGDEEAYIERGNHAGLREIVERDAEVWTYGKPVSLHPTPPQVEIAALTLLQKEPQANHLGLLYYLQALGDPDERRSLDRFIWEEIQPSEKQGYICWREEWDQKHSAADAIWKGRPQEDYPQTREARFAADLDKAILRLATAIRDFRIAGRPEGSYSSGAIQGLDALMGYVETSLPAAIAEYHNHVLNIYAGGLLDLESALKDVTPKDLITQSEAARSLGFSTQAISNAIREGRLRGYIDSDNDAPPHTPGRRKVSKSEVEALWGNQSESDQRQSET